MTPDQISFLDTVFVTVRTAREEADDLVNENVGALSELLLVAKAAHILQLKGLVTEAGEWEAILQGVYALAAREHNLTPQEVQDYAMTVKRMKDELTEIGAGVE